MSTKSKPGFVIGRVGDGVQDNSGAGAKAFAMMLAAQKNGRKQNCLTIPEQLAETIKFFKSDSQPIVEFLSTLHVFIVDDKSLGDQPKKDYEITSRAVQNLASHFQLYAPETVLLTCLGRGERAATRENILRLLNKKQQGRPARITLYFYGHTVPRSGHPEDNDFSWIIADGESVHEKELRQCDASLVNIVADSCYPERLFDGTCSYETYAQIPCKQIDVHVGQTAFPSVAFRDPSEMTQLRGEKDELSAKLAESAARIEDLTARLRASDAAKVEWEKEKVALKADIEAKSKELVDSYQLLGQRRTELDDAKGQFDKLQQRFDAAQANHVRDMQILQEQMKKAEDEAVKRFQETKAAHEAAMEATRTEHAFQVERLNRAIEHISNELRDLKTKRIEVNESIVDSHGDNLARIVETQIRKMFVLEHRCQELNNQILMLDAEMQKMHTVFEGVSGFLEAITTVSEDIHTTVEKTLPLMILKEFLQQQAFQIVASSVRDVFPGGGASFHPPDQIWGNFGLHPFGTGGAAAHRPAMSLEFSGGMPPPGGGLFVGPARGSVSPALTSSRSGSEVDCEALFPVRDSVLANSVRGIREDLSRPLNPEADADIGRKTDSTIPGADAGVGPDTLAKAAVAAAVLGVPNGST